MATYYLLLTTYYLLLTTHYLLLTTYYLLPGKDQSKYGANVAFYLQSRSVGNHISVTDDPWLSCAQLQTCGRGVWTVFEAYLQAACMAEKHVVISSEEFAPPTVDIPLLAGALRLFRTTIVIVHRPYFQWLVSLHSEIMHNRYHHRRQRLHQGQQQDVPALEDFLTTDYIVNGASSSGFHTLAVYQRYRLYFDHVSLHAYSHTVLPEIVCTDMQASATCARLRSGGQIIANANKSALVAEYTPPSCMDSKRKQLLWTLSAGIEVQAQVIMGHTISMSHLTDEWKRTSIRECSS